MVRLLEKIEVIIEEYGTSVGKKSERLIVRQKRKVVNEVPFYDISEISIITSGVSISTDLIWECSQRGIPINFLLRSGEPFAKIMSPNMQGTVKTRRAQLLAFEDQRGVELAKAFAIGKLQNQQVLLKYFLKYRKQNDPQMYSNSMKAVDKITTYIEQIKKLQGEKIDDLRGQLLAYEGQASKKYWSIFSSLVSEKYKFPGRKTQGAIDLVNSLLNYGYGILYSKVWGAIMRAGLDPYGGFIHVDRPGKPSLVLDLIEEFRQPVVDRTVLAGLNKGKSYELDDKGLSDSTRKELAKHIMMRLESTAKYRGHKHKIRNIIQRQARHLAVVVRGEGIYRPFISTW